MVKLNSLGEKLAWYFGLSLSVLLALPFVYSGVQIFELTEFASQLSVEEAASIAILGVGLNAVLAGVIMYMLLSSSLPHGLVHVTKWYRGKTGREKAADGGGD